MDCVLNNTQFSIHSSLCKSQAKRNETIFGKQNVQMTCWNRVRKKNVSNLTTGVLKNLIITYPMDRLPFEQSCKKANQGFSEYNSVDTLRGYSGPTATGNSMSLPPNSDMPGMNVAAKNDHGVTRTSPAIPTPVLNKKTDPKDHAVIQRPTPSKESCPWMCNSQ